MKNRQHCSHIPWKNLLCLSLLVFFSLFLSAQEIADRILAVVNGDVITQTDIQVYEYFLLIDLELFDSTKKQILDQFIDQKLVLQRTDLEISVSEMDLEKRFHQIEERLSPDKIKDRLVKLGMKREDLLVYLRESLLFDRIIFLKFEKDVFVSLAEIEAFYDQDYIPERKRLGLKIPSMLDIVEEIETSVKRKKIENKAADWMRDLRKDADIKLFDE